MYTNLTRVGFSLNCTHMDYYVPKPGGKVVFTRIIAGTMVQLILTAVQVAKQRQESSRKSALMHLYSAARQEVDHFALIRSNGWGRCTPQLQTA